MDMLSMFIVIYMHVYVCKDCFQICDMLVQDIRKAINWIDIYLLNYYNIIIESLIIIKTELISILRLFKLGGNSKQLAYIYIKCWTRCPEEAGGGGSGGCGCFVMSHIFSF